MWLVCLSGHVVWVCVDLPVWEDVQSKGVSHSGLPGTYQQQNVNMGLNVATLENRSIRSGSLLLLLSRGEILDTERLNILLTGGWGVGGGESGCLWFWKVSKEAKRGPELRVTTGNRL